MCKEVIFLLRKPLITMKDFLYKIFMEIKILFPSQNYSYYLHNRYYGI